MQQTTDQSKWTWRWGAPASVAVHALILALLVFGLPQPMWDTPEEPETVNVELLPPPEPEPLEEEPAPEEQQAEEEPATRDEPQQADAAGEQAPPMQVLNPVFEFGEQDTGPRLADDGSAAREEQAPAEEPPTEPAEQALSETISVVPEPLPRVPLTEATTLYSQNATDALAAMTAMDGMPRDRRAGELCVTEMREQLRHADPAFWPDLLPAYRLAEGTLMEVRQAAFRAGGVWYDLAFRCEVNDDVTRVVSFAFTVGDAIPRSEWQGRGLPAS